jgi:hypothetical protein
VIGAYPALRDPRGRACSDLYHAVALANISSLWGTRLGGRKGKTDRLWAHDLWGTEAPRTRLAAGLLRSCLKGCTLRCSLLVSGSTCVLKMLAQWLQPARLETRTKESNTYASSKVANLGCEMKVNVGGIPQGCTIDRPGSSVKGLSKSIFVGTRKMVNYA